MNDIWYLESQHEMMTSREMGTIFALYSNPLHLGVNCIKSVSKVMSMYKSPWKYWGTSDPMKEKFDVFLFLIKESKLKMCVAVTSLL